MLEREQAYRFLGGLDDPIADLVREHGLVRASESTHGLDPGDGVGRLTLNIVGQSISMQAALAVFGRLVGLVGGRITAVALANATDDELRGIGLSYAKARAVRELGVAVLRGTIRFDELEELDDDEVQARLISLRGIGPWSAQMFLLRAMGRPDVFPAGDVGLRHGIELLDRLAQMPSIREAAERALPWRPYRSYAAKYLWIEYARSIA